MKFYVAVFIFCSIPYLRAVKCPPRMGGDTTYTVCSETCCEEIEELGTISNGEFVQYVTSKSGKRLERTTGKFSEKLKHGSIVQINHNKTFQKIEGFGGALTDSVGYVLKSLKNAALRNKIIKLYYQDIRYEFVRVPIGGTDFSFRPYTLDDHPNDVNLTKFALQPEDFKYKIPFIHLMKGYNPNLKMYGTAWSPPAWMKTNNKLYGIGFAKPDMYQILANYYVKFIDAYKSHGIDTWGLSTGNEPTIPFIINVPLNSLCWTYEGMRSFIADYFGPTIKKKYPKCKLFTPEDQRFLIPYLPNQLLEDPKVRAVTDGVSFHWYFNSYFPASSLTELHDAHPDKIILSTEASYISQPSYGNWSNARGYLVDIMEDLNNYCGGWIDWNLCLNETGGPTYISNFVDAPIIVNAKDQEFYIQPMFYTLGQYSKFLLPGSKRIECLNDKNKLSCVAVDRPDGLTAVVLHNDANEDYNIRIKDNVKGTFVVRLEKMSLTTILY